MAKLSEYIEQIKQYALEMLGKQNFVVELLNEYHLILENDFRRVTFYSYRYEGGVSVQIFDKQKKENISFMKLYEDLGSPSFPIEKRIFQDQFDKELYWKFRILQLALNQNI